MTNGTTARSLSFSKRQRLTRSAEFLRVKTDGQTQRGALMMLGILAVKDREASAFRAGFVTPKRLGGAVVRNRIRRRLREIVRRHQRALRSGIWTVTVARPAAAEASYRALEDEWLRLAKRASILAP
jgi:ribonuclease P protein component